MVKLQNTVGRCLLLINIFETIKKCIYKPDIYIYIKLFLERRNKCVSLHFFIISVKRHSMFFSFHFFISSVNQNGRGEPN